MYQAQRFWVIPLLGLLFTSSARAELHFAQAVIDTGEVRRGPTLVHRFDFTNTGNQTIQIIEAKTSCGCLLPKLSSRSIAPGQSGWLDLEVNTLTQPAGPNTWSVRVQYQEGETRGEIVTQLRSQLIAEITVEPAALMITTSELIRHPIHILDERARPFTVTAVQASSPHLKVTHGLEKEGDPHRSTVWVEVTADFPEGTHEDAVCIHTNDPAYSELKVPVTIVKRGKQRISATPRRVVLQSSAAEELPGRIVLLRDGEEQQLLVERIWADDPAILTKCALGPGTMATLKVQVDRKVLGNKELRSTVHVELSGPVRQTLDIPVEFKGQ